MVPTWCTVPMTRYMRLAQLTCYYYKWCETCINHNYSRTTLNRHALLSGADTAHSAQPGYVSYFISVVELPACLLDSHTHTLHSAALEKSRRELIIALYHRAVSHANIILYRIYWCVIGKWSPHQPTVRIYRVYIEYFILEQHTNICKLRNPILYSIDIICHTVFFVFSYLEV